MATLPYPQGALGGSFNPATDYTLSGNLTLSGTNTVTGSLSNTGTNTQSGTQTYTGNGISGLVVAKIVPFVEVATLTTHTGTVTLPAGSMLLDILFWSTVLWTAADAAVVIGDAGSANGWFTTCQLDTTDLVVGERLQASSDNFWGGVNGAYLTTAGRFGQQSGSVIGGYSASAYSVIAVVSKTGAGSAGRSFLMVTYAVGESVAPVVA